MLLSAKRVLVCLHYGIGDVVMQLPVLEALRSSVPAASITLLGALPAIGLFDDDRRWQSKQNIQAWGLEHWGDTGNEEIRSRIQAWMKHHDFDLILDVSHAVQAVKEVIWRREQLILDTGEYLPSFGLNGVAAIKDNVLAQWGLPVAAQDIPRLTLMQARQEFAHTFLRQRRITRQPIGISTLASSSLKRWPLEHLADVADALSDHFDLPVMLFAGPQPHPAAVLAEHMKNHRAPCIIGPLHLLDTAALLAQCAVLICNDTGLMHMAAAVGTPVVAVFGPTAESIYLPPSSNNKGVSSPQPCPYRKTDAFGPSPCLVEGRCRVARRSCIDAIPAADVLRAAVDVLNRALKENGRHNFYHAQTQGRTGNQRKSL